MAVSSSQKPKIPHQPTWPWVTAAVLVIPLLLQGIDMFLSSVEEADQRDKVYLEAVIKSLKDEVTRLTVQRESDFTRIADLQTQNATLSRNLIEKELSIASTAGYPPLETVKEIIRAHPGIFWAKLRLGPNRYVMLGVSEKYAKYWLDGVPSRYEDKTDFEIWPDETALGFVRNDEHAYKNSGNAVQIQEDLPSKGRTSEGTAIGYKWHVRLSSGHDVIFGDATFKPAVVAPSD